MTSLIKCIQWGSHVLKCPEGIDSLALLGAIAEVESDFGALALPRHEKAYDHGGRYFDRERWLLHGALAACSYGSFQIMYATACELGFDWRRSPLDLQSDEVGIIWVVEYIRRRCLDRGAQTISQIGDAYNSGSFKDGNYPQEYVNKLSLAYAGVVKRRNLKEGEEECSQ